MTPQKCSVIKKHLAKIARPTARINTWVTTATQSSSLYLRVETHPKINYGPLLLVNSPSVCPEVSRSNTHFRPLSNNSGVIQLKIFYRPSGVDISGVLFNTWKPCAVAAAEISPSICRYEMDKTAELISQIAYDSLRQGKHRSSKNLFFLIFFLVLSAQMSDTLQWPLIVMVGPWTPTELKLYKMGLLSYAGFI